MILVLRKNANEEQVATVCRRLSELGLTGQPIYQESNTFISIFENASKVPAAVFHQLPGVEKVLRMSGQLSLVHSSKPGAVRLRNGIEIGGDKAIVIAGPCSVENREHIIKAAHRVKQCGAHMLRGGAFKPRTSPYDFQGLGQDGLKFLSEAARETGLCVVSEVMAPSHIEIAAPYIDVLQVGARNMYNYDLLKEIGRSAMPVLLKRGLSATINEWLNAAEYIMVNGNRRVILCERGIRTFETHTRNTLDLSAVAALKGMTSLPVIVDPSHAAGRPELIRPLSRAAIACGADGLIIEVHDSPADALSDGEQAISSAVLRDIVHDVRRYEETFPRERLPGVDETAVFDKELTAANSQCCSGAPLTVRS